MRACVVVPTNRPERIKQFVAAWEPQFHQSAVRLIVVEDAPTWTPDLLPEWVEHRCWLDIDRELGDKASCIPTRSGGIRDFGFWLAGNDESIDMIVSLDDDVLPIDGVDFLREHWRMLETLRNLRWWQPVPGFRLRGEPYAEVLKKAVLNLGLWTGFPDIDAKTQLSNPDAQAEFETLASRHSSQLVPLGMYFPCCGMNFAARREAAPFIYFPKLPDGMRRFDDIWMGIIFKRIIDQLGWAVAAGWPILQHDRASDPLSNLKQEFLGYGLNEQLWRVVDRVQGHEYSTPIGIYLDIIEHLRLHLPQLSETAKQMQVWASLWDGSRRVPEDKLPVTNWTSGGWKGGQFIQAPVAHCMHGGWMGVPEKGVYGADGYGRPLEYDWQCSECKRWFPKDH